MTLSLCHLNIGRFGWWFITLIVLVLYAYSRQEIPVWIRLPVTVSGLTEGHYDEWVIVSVTAAGTYDGRMQSLTFPLVDRRSSLRALKDWKCYITHDNNLSRYPPTSHEPMLLIIFTCLVVRSLIAHWQHHRYTELMRTGTTATERAVAAWSASPAARSPSPVGYARPLGPELPPRLATAAPVSAAVPLATVVATEISSSEHNDAVTSSAAHQMMGPNVTPLLVHDEVFTDPVPNLAIQPADLTVLPVIVHSDEDLNGDGQAAGRDNLRHDTKPPVDPCLPLLRLFSTYRPLLWGGTSIVLILFLCAFIFPTSLLAVELKIWLLNITVGPAHERITVDVVAADLTVGTGLATDQIRAVRFSLSGTRDELAKLKSRLCYFDPVNHHLYHELPESENRPLSLFAGFVCLLIASLVYECVLACSPRSGRKRECHSDHKSAGITPSLPETSRRTTTHGGTSSTCE